MTRTPSSLLRSWLTVALIAPGLSAVNAAAQAVIAPVGASGAATAGSAAAGAASHGVTTMPSLISPAIAPALGSINASAIAPVLNAPAAPAAAGLLAAPAPALAARLAAADGPTPLQQPLKPGQYWSPHADGHRDPRMGTGDEMVHSGPRGRELVPISSLEAPEVPEDWSATRSRSARTFDGMTARKDLPDNDAVAGAGGRSAAPLAKPTAAPSRASAAAPAVPIVDKTRYYSLALKIALGVALFLLTPSIALAQAVGAPMTAASTLGILAAIRPAAAAVGAVAGAVYGMIAARPKDGSEASSGEMFSSVLRYGALGGASVYMLLDVTSLAFIGPTAGGGLQPLSSAVVTAALGRTAFQGKFMDAATSSADRIVGSFPAVAAALGISLGVVGFGFVAPPIAVTVALAAMTVTGVATALYAALFKVGRSPLDGPAKMAKGFVLQALMTGLALAVSNHYLFGIFAAMGAAGFGFVLWGMARELMSFLPGHAAPAPAPTTPTTPPAPPKA